jgi:uncharacterized Rmd1/YagE family protein
MKPNKQHEENIMIKTEIYLDEDIYHYLQEQSEISHLSISDIIKQSIKKEWETNVDKILAATEKVYGIWEDRTFDVDEYVRNMRKDREL